MKITKRHFLVPIMVVGLIFVFIGALTHDVHWVWKGLIGLTPGVLVYVWVWFKEHRLRSLRKKRMREAAARKAAHDAEIEDIVLTSGANHLILPTSRT